MDWYILTTSCCKCLKSVLRNSKHTSRTRRTIIACISSILDLIRNWYKDKICHKFYNITRSPVFSGFFIVFFVKFTNKFLKNSTHAMIIKAWMLEDRLLIILIYRVWTKINIRRHELLYNWTENISVNHCCYLISEFKLFKYLLYIRRKTIQICFKISF